VTQPASAAGSPEHGVPLTLGNMRERARVKLAVTCELCHHEAVLPVGRWDDAGRGPRHPAAHGLHPGIVGADARPNWREFTAAGKYRWRCRPVIAGG
jgi:hypothetical protein